MFSYSSSDVVIPSLVFTKAELVYAISVLMAEMPPDDNTTGIEMVEIRHYLNLIKDRVALAASDGTLRRALAASADETGKDTQQGSKASPAPSMEDLRREFPNLMDFEIVEVIETAKKERREEDRKMRDEEAAKLPPKPSFIAKPVEAKATVAPPEQQPAKSSEDRENSEKFAKMLGAF